MKSPFAVPSEKTTRVSPGQVQALLNLYQQDLYTGVLNFSVKGVTEEFYGLTYLEGKPISLYHGTDDGINWLPGENKSALYTKSQMEMWLVPLSPPCLPAIHTILEQAQQAQTQEISTTDVNKHLEILRVQEEPQLILLQWPSATGFTFLPGAGIPNRMFYFIKHDHTTGQAIAMPGMPRWYEPNCRLTRFAASPASLSWETNKLLLAFSIFFEQLMVRYDELAGATLVRRLEDHLNTFTRTHSWQISFVSRSLENSHYFSSVREMGNGYNTILQTCSKQMETVLGPKLVQDAIRGCSTRLPLPLRTALQSLETISGMRQ